MATQILSRSILNTKECLSSVFSRSYASFSIKSSPSALASLPSFSSLRLRPLISAAISRLVLDLLWHRIQTVPAAAERPEVPSKDPKKKDEKKDEDLEDLALKQQLELYVERVQDSDPRLQKVALERMRQEIRTSTSSMTSVPKPLKFLRPHYGTLKAHYETLTASDIKVHGFVQDNRTGEKVAMLVGKWDEAMYYVLGNPTTKSKGYGPMTEAVLLWERGKSITKTRYNLIPFAICLNELTPRLLEKLPPTDSRLRPDQRHLENGEYELANAEKLKLEQL